MNIELIIEGLSGIKHPGIQKGVLADLKQLEDNQWAFNEEEWYGALEFQAEVLGLEDTSTLTPNDRLLVHSAAFALRR